MRVRQDFPILERKIHGHPLVYLDNAASTQRPNQVVDAVAKLYQHSNANVHRGIHTLSLEASDLYDEARTKVAKFIGAPKSEEVIFNRGTTEGINMVSLAWGRKHIKPGDDVLVTRMEHHSNFVPWQAMAKEMGANFKIIELTPDWQIDLDDYRAKLSGKPKVVALAHTSNTLGTVNPVAQMASMAKEAGAELVVVDGAQGVVHQPVDMKTLGPIDFYAFSAHKLCGPTGMGALWGRYEVLSKMEPFHYGGGMILKVGDEETTYTPPPYRFEAGTPNIAGAVGFGAAVEYLGEIGMDKIQAHEEALTGELLSMLGEIPGLQVQGPTSAKNRGPAVSFTMETVHPHDLATYLDTQGIAIRAGHHCAQPLMRKVGVTATSRASICFYNTSEEIQALGQGLRSAMEYFS